MPTRQEIDPSRRLPFLDWLQAALDGVSDEALRLYFALPDDADDEDIRRASDRLGLTPDQRVSDLRMLLASGLILRDGTIIRKVGPNEFAERSADQ